MGKESWLREESRERVGRDHYRTGNAKMRKKSEQGNAENRGAEE